MCVTIGLENKPHHAYPPDRVLHALQASGAYISSYYSKNGQHLMIKAALDTEAVRKNTCGVLAEYMMENYIWPYMDRFADEIYCYFNTEEKQEISRALVTPNEIARLSEKIDDYLQEETALLVGGFVHFRLSDYLCRMESYLEVVVDDLLMKKEYYEFIKLLKYFVELQDSKYDEVHVRKGDGFAYILTDAAGNRLSKNCETDFLCEISDGEFGVYDMLLSELISTSPKKIVIHDKASFQGGEILETIEAIFEGCVEYCDDSLQYATNHIERNDRACGDVKIDLKN